MKKFISILLIFLVAVSIPFAVSAAGSAFLVMDGRTGAVLEQENGDTPLPMASTTKVMTALCVLERAELSAQVTIPKEAAGVEGSSLYIKAGECYTVEELLYGLMLQSANDCAVALAWYVGGENTTAFVEMMNAKAKALGLKNTHFENPNGLSAEGHHTTAQELALIMRAAMADERFRTISGTWRYTVHGQTIVNHNRLLQLYDDCISGKTGYTMEAGRCLVTVAERDGAPLICVTLGRRNDWNIHTDAYEKWFKTLSLETLTEPRVFSVDLPVAGGGTVKAVNCDPIRCTLFQYDGSAEAKVLAGPFLYGNRDAGDVVGTVQYWYQGVLLGESPLILTEAIVMPVKKELFITRIFRFFRHLFLKK